MCAALLAALTLALMASGAARAADLVLTGCSVAACESGEIGSDFRDGTARFAVRGELSGAGSNFLSLRFFRFAALDVRYEYADGSVRRQTYDQSVAVENWQPGAQFLLPVPTADAPLAGVSFGVGPSYEAHLLGAAKLVTADEAQRSGTGQLLLFGALIGMVLVPLLANLALFFSLRKGFQIAYGIFSLAVLIYGFCWSNAIFAIFPEASFSLRYGLVWASIGVAVLANIVFLVLFVEEGKIPPLPKWMLLGSVGVFTGLCFYAAGNQLVLPAWFYTAQHAPLLVAYPALAACCVYAVRRGSRLVWFYIAGWTPLLLAALARVLRGMGVIPHDNSIDLSIFGALAFEVFVFSIAIGVKAYMLRKERDAAQARQRDLAEEANTDPLTSVLNRRGLLDRLKRLRRGQQIAMFLIDIDHFKRVNDRHGHYTGDVVLAEFAQLISQVFPGSLTVRCGGEEFGVIVPRSALPALPVDAAIDLLEEIRAHDFALPEGGVLNLSASIGVAVGAVDPETFWTALYRQADQALFLAKANGRDRIESNAGIPQFAAAL